LIENRMIIINFSYYVNPFVVYVEYTRHGKKFTLGIKVKFR